MKVAIIAAVYLAAGAALAFAVARHGLRKNTSLDAMELGVVLVLWPAVAAFILIAALGEAVRLIAAGKK